MKSKFKSMLGVLWALLLVASKTSNITVNEAKNFAFSLTGMTVMLNNIPYFVPPGVVANISNNLPWTTANFGLTPVTVVSTNAPAFDSSDLWERTARFLSVDDVFQKGFLQLVLIQHVGNDAHKIDISSLGISAQILQQANPGAVGIPEGPYFCNVAGQLRQAYRLFPDAQGAFTETVIAYSDDTWSVLPANIPGQSLAVAVPSRLYFTRNHKQPLAGVRLGVKDLFDMQGLRTSGGSRAWYNLYSPANETSVAVENLVSAGAIVVGKMKTSQFANSESATADWVDYHAPFNPRGDGYQDPSASSAGPASGEASYPWLDITLGSDTGGSIRTPCQIQGLFGNRPTHGLVSLKNVMPLSPQFDTAGLFARDPTLLFTAARALYGTSVKAFDDFPTTVIIFGFPPRPSRDESEFSHLLHNFLGKLTGYLNGTSRLLDMDSSWSTTFSDSQPLTEYLKDTYQLISSKDQARLIRDPFFAEYAKVHHGRRPHVNPAPLKRWKFGDDSTRNLTEARRRIKQFSEWFNSEILPACPATCSKHLLVYVPRVPSPKYRDSYSESPQLPADFTINRAAVLSGTPDIVLPLGQISYFSSVTNHMEYLPVTIDIMAARGCDGMLFSLVEMLTKRGIIRPSQVGVSLIDSNKA